MNFDTIAIIGVVLFLVLMFLKMHIGLSMALSGIVGLFLVRGINPALNISSIIVWGTGSSYFLTVLPLFILMGLFAAYGGISKDAFNSVNKWIGHLKGGLAMATMLACAAFGAVCGSASATAATMVAAAFPEMRRYKYNDELSLGAIAAGGNLGFIIPPSASFVVYGFITQTSIGALFISGILPGLLLTVLFCITIYIMVLLKPSLTPSSTSYSWLDRLKSFKGLWAVIVVFVLVMGGIYMGVFTPTEAAAVGAFVTFVIGIATRQLNISKIVKSLYETSKSSAMVFLLMFGAMIFSAFLTSTEITLRLGNLITSLNMNRYVIMAIVLVIYVILGFFMDIWAVQIVSLPIVFPIIVDVCNFDPLVFGVLCTLTIMIGNITPPVGLVVFVVQGLAPDVPVYTIFRGCTPFVITMVLFLIIVVIFPDLTLVLPSQMLPYR